MLRRSLHHMVSRRSGTGRAGLLLRPPRNPRDHVETTDRPRPFRRPPRRICLRPGADTAPGPAAAGSGAGGAGRRFPARQHHRDLWRLGAALPAERRRAHLRDRPDHRAAGAARPDRAGRDRPAGQGRADQARDPGAAQPLARREGERARDRRRQGGGGRDLPALHAGGCFAETGLGDDTFKRWRGLGEAGQMRYLDAGRREVTLPISFRGFPAAAEALQREQP